MRADLVGLPDVVLQVDVVLRLEDLFLERLHALVAVVEELHRGGEGRLALLEAPRDRGEPRGIGRKRGARRSFLVGDALPRSEWRAMP